MSRKRIGPTGRRLALPSTPVDPFIEQSEDFGDLQDLIAEIPGVERPKDATLLVTMRIVFEAARLGKHEPGTIPGRARALARVCEWDHDPEALRSALIDSGWLRETDDPERLYLVSWEGWGGRVLAQREYDTSRKGNQRDKPIVPPGQTGGLRPESDRTDTGCPTVTPTGCPTACPAVGEGEGEGEELEQGDPRAREEEPEPSEPDPAPRWDGPQSCLTTARGPMAAANIDAALCQRWSLASLPGGWVPALLRDMRRTTLDAEELRDAVEHAEEARHVPDGDMTAAQAAANRAALLGLVRHRLLAPPKPKPVGSTRGPRKHAPGVRAEEERYGIPAILREGAIET